MDKHIIYGFLAGLYAGRFTNMFSNIVVTSLVLYFYEPDFYTYNNINNIRDTTINVIKSLGN